MIPKVIHYCWFGNNPLPEKTLKCIDSWKKYCPDYEIKRWDETNFDYKCCNYVMEAYREKKWAFVSDYARFKILYENGGLYFDTDVEIIRSLNKLIANGAFMGCEQWRGKMYINPGLGIAAEAGMRLFKRILEYYERESFLRNDGMSDTKTVCARVTEILLKDGFIGTGYIEYVDDIYLYPPEYFSPKDFETGRIKLTKNTVSIHHYDATWFEPEEKKSYEIEQYLKDNLGIMLGTFVNFPIHYFYRFKLRIRQKGSIIKALYYFGNKVYMDKLKKCIKKREISVKEKKS